MTPRPRRGEEGFLLVFSIVILLVLSLAIPALVIWVRQETKDTVKIKRSTSAFHLAEAGVDQGIWKLQEAMATWTSAKTGVTVAEYDGNTQYAMSFQDGSTGYYTIKFTSGPSADQVTILAKGRDPSTKEVRSIQAVVEANGAGEFAMQAKKTISFGGSTNVEWGPVIAKNIISAAGVDHPRLLTSSYITPMTAACPASPDTDGYQWWACKSDLPPPPQIDFASYKSSAIAYGNSLDADCGSYYKDTPGTFTFTRCQDTTGKVFYIEDTTGGSGGNCDFATAGTKNYIVGDVLCMGNVNVRNAGAGTENLTVPPEAWKEYGNDLDYYINGSGGAGNFDPAFPYNTGVDHTDYTNATNAKCTRATPPLATYSVSNIIVHGFIYTGGSSGLTGGGNSCFVGAMYSANDSSLTTSGFSIYYDPNVAKNIKTTNVVITRESWKEVAGSTWP